MRKLLIALTATFVVVVVSGLYQGFRYQPAAEAAWPGLKVHGGGRSVLYDTTEFVHRWGSYLFVALLLATAVVWVSSRARRVRPGWGADASLVVVALAAIACVITGPRLRWDQMALWAVTMGDSAFRNLWELTNVKYVLVGSKELGVDEFRRSVWVHTAILPAVIALALGALWAIVVRSTRPTSVEEPAPPIVSEV